ncbi:hypothetical protein ACFE04_012732 [Oxalis oulophora]
MASMQLYKPVYEQQGYAIAKEQDKVCYTETETVFTDQGVAKIQRFTETTQYQNKPVVSPLTGYGQNLIGYGLHEQQTGNGYGQKFTGYGHHEQQSGNGYGQKLTGYGHNMQQPGQYNSLLHHPNAGHAYAHDGATYDNMRRERKKKGIFEKLKERISADSDSESDDEKRYSRKDGKMLYA